MPQDKTESTVVSLGSELRAAVFCKRPPAPRPGLRARSAQAEFISVSLPTASWHV